MKVSAMRNGTDNGGTPLTVQAFEGHNAETATLLPVINAFKSRASTDGRDGGRHAGMISEANQTAAPWMNGGNISSEIEPAAWRAWSASSA
jgi:hypothetical protein